VQSSAATYGSASIAVAGATISGVEVLELEADHNGAANTAFTIDMDLIDGVTSVVLDANDTDGVNTFNLDDLSAAQAGAITLQGATGTSNGSTINLDLADGSGATDAAVITASVATGNTVTIGDDNGDIESLTVAMNGGVDVALAIATTDFAGSTTTDGSITVTGGASGKTMTITGGASNLTAETLDLSGVASDTTATIGTVAAKVTGGTGDDDITFGTTLTNADVIDLGAGNDRVIITPSAAMGIAPSISNVEELQIGATASVSLNLDSVAIPELILTPDMTASNVVTVRNTGSITNVTVTSSIADSNGDTFNGLTFAGSGLGTAGVVDAIQFDISTVTDAATIGDVNVTGYETVTISVTGDADEDAATFGQIIGAAIDNIIVTSSGFGSTTTATDIDLDDITSNGGGDVIQSFTAATADTGVTVDLSDMAATTSVTGSAYYDNLDLTGSAAGVIVYAGAGNDTVQASASGGTVYGEAGNDTITGSDAADILDGGLGNDTIQTEGGGDTVTTGTGADIIVFDDDVDAAADVVTITDFDTTTDTLHIDDDGVAGGSLIPGLTPGTLVYTEMGTGTETSNDVTSTLASNQVIVVTDGTFDTYDNLELELDVENGGTDLNDVIVVFLNSTSGVAEMYADGVMGTTTNDEILLASFSSITTDAGLAAFDAGNFVII
jgi:hypothetical protein